MLPMPTALTVCIDSDIVGHFRLWLSRSLTPVPCCQRQRHIDTIITHWHCQHTVSDIVNTLSVTLSTHCLWHCQHTVSDIVLCLSQVEQNLHWNTCDTVMVTFQHYTKLYLTSWHSVCTFIQYICINIISVCCQLTVESPGMVVAWKVDVKLLCSQLVRLALNCISVRAVIVCQVQLLLPCTHEHKQENVEPNPWCQDVSKSKNCCILMNLNLFYIVYAGKADEFI